MRVLLCAVLSLGLAGGLSFAFVAPESREKGHLEIEPPSVRLDPRTADSAAPAELSVAAREFLTRHPGEWRFRSDSRLGRPLLVEGRGIPLIPGAGNTLDPATFGASSLDGLATASALEPLARDFVETQRALLVPERGELVFDPQASLARDEGRLISFYWNWHVEGVPVEGARVFVRVNSGNVVQFGAPLVGTIDLDVVPRLSAVEAVERLLSYSGDSETARLAAAPRLLIEPLASESDASITHRLVWRFTYTLAGRIETWEGRVDAHSGAIVGFRDLNRYARAVGGVYPRTVIENNEIRVPLPSLSVNTAAGNVASDVAGRYAYTGGEAQAGLDGVWFNTSCQGCTSPSSPSATASIGIGRLDFGVGGADEVGNGLSTPADRNAFYHLNQVRRLGLKWLPGLDFLAEEAFTVNVNITATCNAVYTGNAVNFYRSGGGCNNTGEIADVMHHEYGHGIDQETQGGDGATGEATADVVAMHLTHDPAIGPGFHMNGEPVRDLDATTSPNGFLTTSNVTDICPTQCNCSFGPLGAEVHCEGEIYGQAAWELSQALVAKHGHHTGWRTSEAIFFNSLNDAGGYLPNSSLPVYDAYVAADDDDGNLANGTPNAQQIHAAFSAHGIAGPALPGTAGCTRPNQPALNVTPDCDRFDLSWSPVPGIAHYLVLRSELFEDTTYFPVAQVAAGQTSYEDELVAPDHDYWYVVIAVAPNGCESRSENPVHARLEPRPVLSVTGAVADDDPMGNHSGFPDPDEQVDLTVTLGNIGALGSSAISAEVTSSTPGVTMLDGSSAWVDLAPSASGVNLDVLRFETDAGQVSCGDVLSFQLVPEDASVCAGETSYFEVRVGELLTEHADSFESDLGWAPDEASSTADTGQWVLGDPEVTNYQPGTDVTEGGGTDCWYTGANPGGAAGTNDVDDGVVVLLSPVFDLSGLEGIEVSYWRWFEVSIPGADPGDFFRAEVSSNGGSSWVTLEELSSDEPAPAWVEQRFALDGIVPLTNQMRFRFLAADAPPSGAVIEAAIDEFRISRSVCDDTPACFAEPTFAGAASATPGSSCGIVDVSWAPATSNCVDGEITYNVYRSTTPGTPPSPATLVHEGLTGTALSDIGLEPGVTYFYVVRAHDSRSGEDSNLLERTVTSPVTPDDAPPVFGGLVSASAGPSCGEVLLDWEPAIESCNGPAVFEVHRSTDPDFVPGPSSLVGVTFAAGFVDTSAPPGVPHAYLVRARDGQGNIDTNDQRLMVSPGVLDRLLLTRTFEGGPAGWAVTAPNDATAGQWQLGNPQGTSYQPENDVTPPPGVSCWITGLSPTPSNGDVDGGTTTLLSETFNLGSAVSPAVSYSRWFTNDQGASPGDATDTLRVEVSNDGGGSWTLLEEVGAGTPLAWLPVQHALPVPPTSQVRLRFQAADLGAGSVVEAGIDELRWIDVGQGCASCLTPVQSLCEIELSRQGDDIVVDWSANPVQGRVVVYHVTGCGPAARIKLGSTDEDFFVHEDAALSAEPFNYRVTFVDPCGAELPFCGTTDCP